MGWREISFVCSLVVVLGCSGDEEGPTPIPPGTPGTPGTAAPEGPAAPVVEARTHDVCTGRYHSCVMQAEGSVFCTGRNLNGQLGDGTTQERHRMVPVAGLEDATRIACGNEHTCAVREGGGVVCWGRNYEGAVGSDGLGHTPRAVSGLTGVVQIALGENFSCARQAAGTVSCWGKNADGQLGTGETSPMGPVALVQGLSGATDLSAGRAHACAVRAGGEVVCWGSNSSKQGGLGESGSSRSLTPQPIPGLAGVVDVEAGGNHTCARSPDAAHCWGQNDYGQCGTGPVAEGERPERNIPSPLAVAALVGADEISIASKRTCFRAEGAVKCFGYNNYVGELLGVGSVEEMVLEPAAVTGLTDASRIVTHDDHACAIRGERLACWGAGSNGMLGNGEARSSKTPFEVASAIATIAAEPSVAPTLAPVESLPVSAQLALGRKHVCTVIEGGRVRCFGENMVGQLGIGSTQSIASNVDTTVLGLEGAIEVSANGATTCALRNGGEVVCWGERIGGMPNTSSPYVIGTVTGAVELDVGGSFLCVRTTEGAVHCLGESRSGQLGRGDRESSEEFGPVPGVEGATQLALTDTSACAVVAGGALRCWGSGRNGALGNGATDNAMSPIDGGLRNVDQLDGAYATFCAVARGRVSCWGANSDGQVGNGEMSSDGVMAPARISSLRGIANVRTGGGSSCAVLTSGEAKCWGANAFGQTGHNESDTDDVTSPWEVLRSTDATVGEFGLYATMECGSNFCCGLHLDGHVSCAGSTPIGGSGGFLGISSSRGTTPIPAPGFQAPLTPEG